MTHNTGIPIDPSIGRKIHYAGGQWSEIRSDFLVPLLNARLPSDMRVIPVNSPVFESDGVVFVCAHWPELEHTVSIGNIMDAQAFSENLSLEEALDKYVIDPILVEVSSKIISGGIPLKYFCMISCDVRVNEVTFEPRYYFTVRGSTGIPN